MDILNSIDQCIINNYDEDFFQLYLFSNENIGDYKSYFDLNGKSLLTVGSSIDQVINASLDNCSNITICDICPLTKYFYYLKLSSLLVLDRKEFLDFLCVTNYKNNKQYNPQFLSKKLFNKISDCLKNIDYESYFIWYYILNKYSKVQIRKLFRSDISNLESIIYCNKYLKNDELYNKARRNMPNISINIYNEDIALFNYDKKYDNIWLSNVAQYLNEDKKNMLLNNCYNNMHKDSMALICYFWNESMTIKGCPIFDIKNLDLNKIIIDGTSKYDYENSILVYKKK